MNKKTLNFCAILLLLLAASCSTPPIEKVKTKAAYISRINRLSGSELQKTLKTDLDSLTSLKNELEGFNIYIGFGMSMSDGSGKKAELTPDSAFKLNTNFASIQKDLDNYAASLTFVETPGLPNSTFEVVPDAEFHAISADNIKVNLKQLYAGGKPYTPEGVGLKRIDSIKLDYHYAYPKSMEVFQFNPAGKKEITYNGKTIAISQEGKESLDFDAPIDLYTDMLAWQARNPSGVLMNASSHSAMPLTTIKNSILKDCAAVVQILKSVTNLTDKAAIITALNKIPDAFFPAIAEYHTFSDEFKKMDSDESLKGLSALKHLKGLMTNHASLFGVEKQRVSLKFPDQIGELIIYLARDKENISGSASANARMTELPYQTYLDSKLDKYGIIDSNYKIVVPASENQLESTDNSGLYYKNRKDNQSFHLDVAHQKLVPLTKGYTFSKALNEHLAVFIDSNKYVGVLADNEKEIIPFEYDAIEKNGDVLLLTKSKRGRKKYEIRNLNNQLVTDLKGLTVTPFPDYGIFMIKNDKDKLGLIDKNGKIVIEPTYVDLKPIDKGPLLAYVEDANSRLQGIMKGNGTKVTEAKFAFIGPFQDDFAIYRTESDEHNKTYGYLNKKGEPVLGKYTVAYGFEGGYALVYDNDVFSMIDSSGKKVKQLPVKSPGDAVISASGKQTIYEIDGKKYNYAGEPVN